MSHPYDAIRADANELYQNLSAWEGCFYELIDACGRANIVPPTSVEPTSRDLGVYWWPKGDRVRIVEIHGHNEFRTFTPEHNRGRRTDHNSIESVVEWLKEWVGCSTANGNNDSAAPLIPSAP